MDLGDLKQRIVDARAKRPSLIRAANAAEQWLRRARLWLRIAQWPILRTLFKQQLMALTEAVEDAEHIAATARDARDNGMIAVDIPLNEEARAARDHLIDSFYALRASTVWSVAAATEIDRAKHRSSAIAALVRNRVTLDREGPEVIASAPLHLPAAGGDLRLYPSFVMIGSEHDFRLIDLDDCRVEYAVSDFIEQEAVPPDAERLGTAWLKSNKDGSPDRRFRANRELPLVRYGHLEVIAQGVPLVVYQVSNAQAARTFANAFADYQWAIAGKARGQGAP